MTLFENVFQQIALLMLVAAAAGALVVWLRQPLIMGYILAGVVLGPSVLGWITIQDQVDLLAKMGIAILLFVVGLKLDLHLIRTVGPVALATGLGQVFFTSVIGYFLALPLGLSPVAALYVAVALTFSSTIIVVKLLSDKREIDALHGRIAVGFLIVQDIVVVLVMIGLSAFGAAGASEEVGQTLLAVVAQRSGLHRLHHPADALRPAPVAAPTVPIPRIACPLLHCVGRSFSPFSETPSASVKKWALSLPAFPSPPPVTGKPSVHAWSVFVIFFCSSSSSILGLN